MFGSLNFYMAGEFEKAAFEGILHTIGVTRRAELFDCRALRRNNCPIAMRIDQFFGANKRFLVELCFDVSIELEIVRLLIVCTLLATDLLRRLVFRRAVDNDIDIFKDTLVPFQTQVRLRVNRKQSSAPFGTRKREPFGVDGNIPGQLRPTANRFRTLLRAAYEVIPCRHCGESRHDERKQNAQDSYQPMYENPL